MDKKSAEKEQLQKKDRDLISCASLFQATQVDGLIS
jgi:alkylhydroperoxidase/carboxymuconolactone decarboxylase family protein YurZ